MRRSSMESPLAVDMLGVRRPCPGGTRAPSDRRGTLRRLPRAGEVGISAFAASSAITSSITSSADSSWISLSRELRPPSTGRSGVSASREQRPPSTGRVGALRASAASPGFFADSSCKPGFLLGWALATAPLGQGCSCMESWPMTLCMSIAALQCANLFLSSPRTAPFPAFWANGGWKACGNQCSLRPSLPEKSSEAAVPASGERARRWPPPPSAPALLSMPPLDSLVAWVMAGWSSS
mmetsp:Transcript_81865/g.226897  ORF Transcript_81865/g.226897 Transcript_81865/m.226897 type:complete len:238 (-) Transcript_81865:1105-1818(-)